MEKDMNPSNLIHSEITGKILKASFEVHKYLGCGFREVFYQRALAREFSSAGIQFKQESEIAIYYKDQEPPIGYQRADFIVEGLVLVELKAKSELEPAHFAQTINYLKVFDLNVGLLINFGNTSLKYKRLINSNYFKSDY